MRLRNLTFKTTERGLSIIQGQVAVCMNGTFLPICDVGWDNSDAQVVCNYAISGSNHFSKAIKF